MRKDFKKLLCECYRYKGYSDAKKGEVKAYQKGSRGDYDEWSHPKTQPMNMGRGTKQFGENLKPLVRFLRSAVGRKWDEVFSEIREACPNDSAVNAHIYQHLWGYVERNPKFHDGDVYPDYKYNRYRSDFPLRDRGRDNTFYIDQEGILRRAPVDSTKRSRREAAEEKKKNSDVRVLDKVYYVRKENIWYETKLVPLPKPYRRLEEKLNYRGEKYTVEVWYYPNFTDVFLGIGGWGGYEVKADRARECIAKYGKSVYCTQLKQLNSRELQRLNLK